MNRVLIVVVTAVAVLLVAGGAWWFLRGRKPPPVATPPPVVAPATPVAAEPVAEPLPFDAGGDVATEAGDGGEVAEGEEGAPPSYERDAESAILDTTTGKRIALTDEGGWEGVAITDADGTLRAVAYLRADATKATACGAPRFFIFEADGNTSRLGYEPEDAEDDAERVESGPFAIVKEEAGLAAFVGTERLIGEVATGSCQRDAPDGGSESKWALIDPSGTLQPMRVVVLP